MFSNVHKLQQISSYFKKFARINKSLSWLVGCFVINNQQSICLPALNYVKNVKLGSLAKMFHLNHLFLRFCFLRQF